MAKTALLEDLFRGGDDNPFDGRQAGGKALGGIDKGGKIYTACIRRTMEARIDSTVYRLESRNYDPSRFFEKLMVAGDICIHPLRSGGNNGLFIPSSYCHFLRVHTHPSPVNV